MLVAAGSALSGGARLALASRFAPDVFWQEVRRYGVSVVFYAGEMARALVRAPFTIGERNHPVRLFAGSGMRPDLWKRLTARFGAVGVLEFYASTEASAVLANADGGKIGAVGHPLPGSPELAIAAYDFDTDELVRDARGRRSAARDPARDRRAGRGRRDQHGGRPAPRLRAGAGRPGRRVERLVGRPVGVAEESPGPAAHRDHQADPQPDEEDDQHGHHGRGQIETSHSARVRLTSQVGQEDSYAAGRPRLGTVRPGGGTVRPRLGGNSRGRCGRCPRGVGTTRRLLNPKGATCLNPWANWRILQHHRRI